MASLVYAVFSITNVASVHCAVRPEISPCTCEPVLANNYVELSCEKVDSFHQIVDALSNKFEPNISISLKISHSQLDDLEMLSFTDMNLNVVKLRLQWNGLRSIPELPFRGLSNVEFLSVGDNELDEIPKNVLNHLPIIKTLDLGRGRIRSVLQDDLKGIQMVKNLFLPGNNITRLDRGSFPPELVTLHLGRNQIESLNGTLRDLVKLESLFINMNSVQTLEDELPESPGLKLILAQNNSLERLPQSMRRLHNLETLHFQNNMLRSFDGVLKNARNLNLLHAFSNQIDILAQDEFEECEYLEELNLADNYIKSVNGSLLPLRRLRIANFSFNNIVEFSMNEVRGLKYLKQLDLSYNKLEKLTGRQDNIIDQHSFLIEFILDHNRLKSLDGALMGLNRLRTLSLSHNQIERILPEDFIGLERLEYLELSHNQLLTLKEMATTFLPNLKNLKVSFNNLTILDNDFHGLPVLCQANLTNNQISSISTTLVSETRCMNHNVPGKLELYLENNPIMCDERLNELCPMMLAQEARIRGRSHCYNSELEVCGELPLIFSQNIPIIIEQLNPQFVPPNSKPLIQLIMPSPILVNGKVKKTDELRPPLIAPLGQPLIKPLLISSSTLHTETTTTTTNGTTSKAAAIADSEITLPSETTPAKPTNITNTTTDPKQSIMPEDTLNSETEQNRTGDATIITAGYPTKTTTTIAPSTTMANTTTTAPPTTTTTIKPILVELLTDDPPVILDIETAELPSQSSQPIKSDSESNIVATSSSSVSNGASGYPTLEYIPKLDQFIPGLNHPVHALDDEVNNSVHEAAYSPSVILDDLGNAQQNLQIPDEPPENP